MTAREWRYTSVLVVAVGIAVAVPWLLPETVDWSDSFKRDDTRPYGSRVLFETLPTLFPEADTVRVVRTSPYVWLRDATSLSSPVASNSSSSPSAYLFVTNTLRLDRPETQAVLDHVARGNVAFMAAQHYRGPLADSLDLESSVQSGVENLDPTGTDSATTRLNLTAANQHRPSGFPVRRDAARYAFTSVDTARTTVLGTTRDDVPTLVRTRWGEGHVILSSTPRVFTNYHTLRTESQQYVWAVLSHLPAGLKAVWWDGRHKPGTARRQSVMRFVLSEPALRMAYWLVLIGGVLFVLMRGRRRQRPVPVVEPPRNRTLDFVRHVGQLYYERGQPIDLAHKMIEHFQTFVRRHLDLPAGPFTPDWVDRVARRASVPRVDVATVVETIETIRDKSALSSDELKTLDDRLDAFYDQAVS